MDDLKQLALRVPPDVKDWLAEQAKRNGSSINSETIRAVRERMDREAIYDATDQTPDEFADGFLRHTAARAAARMNNT